MKRTAGHLADGREIIFFDEADGAPRTISDPRELPPREHRSEMRYDPLLDEWVAVASHRQNRLHLPPTSECPLCPSVNGRHTEIPAAGYDVVVFENRFPSFASPNPTGAANSHRSSDYSRGVADLGPGSQDRPVHLDTLVIQRPAAGRCEVVCFTSDHDAAFSDLTPQRVRLVVDTWVDRTSALSALPRVEQVYCFENRGKEIGVTLAHPHGQIYAYPFVTPHTRQMLRSARRYRSQTGRNLFADTLSQELACGQRIVAETAHWAAFVPTAARWPVEISLYPKRWVPDLPALTDEERDDFAVIYLDLLRRLDSLYGRPLPYVSGWHQAPVRTGRDLAYLHLQLHSIRRSATKLKYLAGSESGMGVFVNDVRPEDMARRLRRLGA